MSDQNLDLSIDLTGMVQIFGDALYKDFGSMVKEIVQNGHDAIIEQALNSNSTSEFELDSKRIDVVFDEYRNVLIVADNGTGMSEPDIRQNLNNFASSKKRQIEKNIAAKEVDNELYHVVGEYGVGFLAAMAISSELKVFSAAKDASPVRWSYSYGDRNASVTAVTGEEFRREFSKRQIEAPSTGTIVVAEIRPEIKEKYWINSEEVEKALERFVSLLPVHVYFNERLLSCRFHAWNEPRSASPQDWQEMIEATYSESPLLVIPIYSPDTELGIHGALWIPERTSFFSQPELDIYVKRMFITTDHELVIPSWARFIKGAINSTKMSRIVSGNTLKNDTNLRQARDFIRDQILDQFRKLKNKSEQEYWRVLGPHDDAVKGSAADDDELMDCVWDKLRFPTKSKKVTIPDYLDVIERRTGERNVYQFDENSQYHSAELVQESTGIPILNLVQSRDGMLVRRICRKNGIAIKTYRELAEKQFKRSDVEDQYQPLIDACAYWNVYAEARSFNPSYFPAVLIEDSGLSDKRDALLRGLREHGEERFAKEFEKILSRQQSANFGTSYYLNTDNELINALLRADEDTQRRTALALYNISFMAAYPELKESERAKVFTSITKALTPSIPGLTTEAGEKSASFESVERAKQERKKSLAATESSIITVFMITPFSEEYKIVEEGVKRFFENPPYCFKVLLARDFTYERNIIGNVRVHIEGADAFVAEISDLNPNVMLELGAAVFAKSDSPVFSLRSEMAKPGVPSDIKSELYIPYKSPPKDAKEISESMRAALESNGVPKDSSLIGLMQRRRACALTATLLSSLRYSFTPEEISSICTSYTSIEEMIADKAHVSSRTGIKVELASAVIADLDELMSKAARVLHRLR